jgi:hypothetical protein
MNNNLLNQDGVVDIIEFIKNDDYLGVSTKQGDLIYPYWIDFLKNTLNKNRSKKDILLTGGTGSGHSTIQAIIIAYYIHVISKTPVEKRCDYFGCGVNDNLKIYLFSTAHSNIVFDKLISFVIDSTILRDMLITKPSNTDRLDFSCGVSVFCDKITSSNKFREKYSDYKTNCALVSVEAYPETKHALENCLSIICPWIANLNRNLMVVSTDKAVICRPINKYMDNSFVAISDESRWMITEKSLPESYFYVVYNDYHAEILNGNKQSNDLVGDFKILMVPDHLYLRDLFERNLNYAIRFIAGIDRHVMKTETGFTFIDALVQLRSGLHEDCAIFKKFNNNLKIKTSMLNDQILINVNTGKELKTIPTEWIFSGHDWCMEYSDSNGL